MGRIGAMVRKDLLRQLRSPLGISATLAFPLLFAGLIALTFGSREPQLPRVRLLVEDRDESLLSGLLLAASGNRQVARYLDVETVGDEGRRRIEAGEASALLVIPEGFGQGLLEGREVELELVRNPAESILPEIAEQGLGVMAELLSVSSRALRAPLDRIATIDEATPLTADDAAAIAAEVYTVIDRAEGLVFPPAITLESVQLKNERSEGSAPGRSSGGSIFLIVLPGISVWSLFLLGDLTMRDILTESRLGTLRRQLGGPIGAGQIVLAKTLFAATVALISLVLLSAIGALFIRRGVDLPGYLTLSAAVVVAVSGWGALTYGLARTERQGGTVSSILLLVFAFIGGSFVQVDSLPHGLRTFAPLSPFYWGTNGYRALIVDGGGLAEIWPSALVLFLFGAVLLALGSLLLRRKVLRGAWA